MSVGSPGQYFRLEGGIEAGAIYVVEKRDNSSPNAIGKVAIGAMRTLHFQVSDVTGTNGPGGVMTNTLDTLRLVLRSDGDRAMPENT